MYTGFLAVSGDVDDKCVSVKEVLNSLFLFDASVICFPGNNPSGCWRGCGREEHRQDTGVPRCGYEPLGCRADNGDESGHRVAGGHLKIQTRITEIRRID